MKSLNPEHVSAVIELINQGPYFRLLSMEVTELGFGHCRMEVDLDTKHLNPFGGLHGGAYASFVDSAAYWASYCDVPEDVGLVSVDLTVNNLCAAKDGKVIVEGKGLKVGRTMCMSEATVVDRSGRLLAHGVSKQMVTEGLQSINQAVVAMGYGELPRKLL